MAVGYVLGALGWMTANEKKFISRYVIYIGVPMNSLAGLLNNLEKDDVSRFAYYLLVPLITILIMLAISLFAAKALRLPRKQSGVFVSIAFLSNTLFIGLPMGLQLFGEPSVPYVMVYYMISTIFSQIIALLLIEHAGKEEGEGEIVNLSGRMGALLKDIFSKPPIIAIFVAIALLLLGLRPPELFMSFAGYIGSTVTPLALMYCGFIIYEMGLKNIRLMRGMSAMLFLRLILSPAVCAAVCILLSVGGLARNVFIMQAALPAVTQITVWAGEYHADEEYAAVGSTLTLFGVFITIPVLMLFLN